MKKNLFSITASVVAIVASGTLLIMPGVVVAATTQTASILVSLTITPTCSITAGPIAFGNVSDLTAASTAKSTIALTCSNLLPYAVSLDAGNTTSSTVDSRLLVGTDNATTLAFQLYSDSGLTTIWGDTSGSDTSAGVGTGKSQSLIVYGQVAANANPPKPDTYKSIVTATVTY